MMVATRRSYGDLDAGAMTASSAPETDASGAGLTLGKLFAVSVAAGVTVWGITAVLSSVFGIRK